MSRNLLSGLCLTLFLIGGCKTDSTHSSSQPVNNHNTSEIVETPVKAPRTDPDWWLNSGAYLYKQPRGLATVQGELKDDDRFRLLYAQSNPVDTDNGYHPQNLLRLVNTRQFTNFTQQVFFKINKINNSASPNRNQSNGVLLLHRYLDGDNLYYVGIRVDGQAVIKKKLEGKYFTLKTARVYPGTYDRDTAANLLPLKRWIGIKTTVLTKPDGNVDITMAVKDDELGSDWRQVIEAEDTGAEGRQLLQKGRAGIRSDFMDVEFENYQATELTQ